MNDMTVGLRKEALVKVYDRCVIPVGLHYYGITENLKKRKQYKTTSLQQYIDEYGWDNISTTIVAEGLTRKEAELLEDKLIKEGWLRGDCINKVGSSGESRDNRYEYYHQRYLSQGEKIKEKYREYSKQWRVEHLEHRKEYDKRYWEEHKDEKTIKHKEWRKNNPDYDKEWRMKNSEHRKEYENDWRSKIENLIYRRVRDYIRYHKPIETPLEAKNKYLEYGYIPSYIKNDDLI